MMFDRQHPAVSRTEPSCRGWRLFSGGFENRSPSVYPFFGFLDKNGIKKCGNASGPMINAHSGHLSSHRLLFVRSHSVSIGDQYASYTPYCSASLVLPAPSDRGVILGILSSWRMHHMLEGVYTLCYNRFTVGIRFYMFVFGISSYPEPLV